MSIVECLEKRYNVNVKVIYSESRQQVVHEKISVA
jgi:hypothetical protein